MIFDSLVRAEQKFSLNEKHSNGYPVSLIKIGSIENKEIKEQYGNFQSIEIDNNKKNEKNETK